MVTGLLCAMSARAENVDGRFGIGFEETLTSLGAREGVRIDQPIEAAQGNQAPAVRAAGLAVRYYTGHLGLEGIVGAGVHMPDESDIEFTGFLSAGALYNFARAPSVNVALGLRALMGWARLDDAEGKAGQFHFGFAFEVPLRAEYFFSPAFAVAGSVGVVLAFNQTAANPLTGQRESYDLALTRGDFSGGLGFTYYFF